MEVGKLFGKQKDLDHEIIMKAIAEAEAGTTGEIRVHISRRYFEKDVFGRASKLFERFGMTRTAQRNAILLYVNLRRHQFAIIGDEGIQGFVGQSYWDGLAKAMVADFHAMAPEKAIAIAVHTIGATLKKYFPIEEGEANPDQLPNHVSVD